MSDSQENTIGQLRIAVIGIGGAGNNAVNNMILSKLDGVEFIVCNTDAQALNQSLCSTKIQLGPRLTKGLGAGSKPDVGRAAAEESLADVLDAIQDVDMLFVTAGAGGGTGTGAMPYIAAAARAKGILTIGVVTKPFHFEGRRRMEVAERGILDMSESVDTLLVIPNQNLLYLANEKTTFAQAFAMADDVLFVAVRTFVDLASKHGLINVDFADVAYIMKDMGRAVIGTGDSQEKTPGLRALDAAERALACPLLEEVDIGKATAAVINIMGGSDMTLHEVDQAANTIRNALSPDASIIFGATFDEHMNGSMRVSVIATGIRFDPKVAKEGMRESHPSSPPASPSGQHPTPHAISSGRQAYPTGQASSGAQEGSKASAIEETAQRSYHASASPMGQDSRFFKETKTPIVQASSHNPASPRTESFGQEARGAFHPAGNNPYHAHSGNPVYEGQEQNDRRFSSESQGDQSQKLGSRHGHASYALFDDLGDKKGDFLREDMRPFGHSQDANWSHGTPFEEAGYAKSTLGREFKSPFVSPKNTKPTRSEPDASPEKSKGFLNRISHLWSKPKPTNKSKDMQDSSKYTPAYGVPRGPMHPLSQQNLPLKDKHATSPSFGTEEQSSFWPHRNASENLSPMDSGLESFFHSSSNHNGFQKPLDKSSLYRGEPTESYGQNHWPDRRLETAEEDSMEGTRSGKFPHRSDSFKK